MNIERVDGLADSVLDGVASDEERAELERLVAGDAEARARVAERRELFETLRRVPAPLPPDDLRDAIMATIRSEMQPPRRHSETPNWRSFLARRPLLGWSYAVAAGLVIGSLATLGVLGKMGREPDRNAPIAGTMAAPAGAEQGLDHGRLDLPGGGLEAQTGSIGRRVRLRLEARASAPFEITIAFRPEELRLASIVPPESGSMSVEQSGGRVVLKSDREMNLEVNWDPRVPAASPLRIGSRASGKEETMMMAVSPKGRDSPAAP